MEEAIYFRNKALFDSKELMESLGALRLKVKY